MKEGDKNISMVNSDDRRTYFRHSRGNSSDPFDDINLNDDEVTINEFSGYNESTDNNNSDKVKTLKEYDESYIAPANDVTCKLAIFNEIRVHKVRFLKSCGLYSCFITIGLSLGIVGPTLLDLMAQTNSDLTTTSLVLPCRAGGYALGSFISGFYYDKINQLKMTIGTMFLSALVTLTIPFMSDIYIVLVLFLLLGLLLGIFEAGGNMFLIHLWGKENPPFMQALHFFYGLGAFIAPMIAEPFLIASTGINIHGGGNCESESESMHQSALMNNSSYSTIIIASVTGINTTLLTPNNSFDPPIPISSDINNATTVDITSPVTNLKYPYGIVGIYGVINSIIFIILLRLYPRTPAHPSRLTTFSKSIIESAAQSVYGQASSITTEETTDGRKSSEKSNRSKFDSISNPVNDIHNALDRIEKEEKHLDDLPFDIVTATHARTGSIAFNKSFRQRHDSTISLRSNHNYSTNNNKVFSRQSSTVSDPVIVGEMHDTNSIVNNKMAPSSSQSSSARNLFKKVVTLQAFNSLSKSADREKNQIIAPIDVTVPSHQDEIMSDIKNDTNKSNTGLTQTIQNKCQDPWKLCIIIMAVAFMHIYYGLEITFGSFLTTYTAKSDLHLDTKVGAQLTSLFWACFTFWRLITIFYISYTGSELAIFISLAIMLLGNIIIVPFGNKYAWALWLGTGTIGIGVSPLWASMFGFLEDYFPVTSRIASSMITAAMVGEFFFPVIIAKYVDCYPMVFAWVTLVCSLCMPVLFIAIVILCRFKLKKATVSTLTHPSESTNVPNVS